MFANLQSYSKNSNILLISLTSNNINFIDYQKDSIKLLGNLYGGVT